MTRWKKDAIEFSVTLNTLSNKDGSTTQVCTIPKPIVESLGESNKLKFVKKGKSILVEAEDRK